MPPAGAIVEADVIVGKVSTTGIVPDAPRAIVTPLTVIELFVKALLPIPPPELFVSVPVTVAAPGIVVVVLFSPTVYPDDGERYEWNESTTSWDQI